MRRMLGTLALTVTIAAGLVTTAHAADVVVKVQEDRTGDVQTRSSNRPSEKATRRVKQSVDIKRATYVINRERPVPTLRAVMKIKEVLPAGHPRKQRFQTRTELAYYTQYTSVTSTGFGAPKVTHTDRSGTVVINCPRARARVFPDRDIVVHVVPLRCMGYYGERAHLQSIAKVMPNQPRRIVAQDWTRWLRGVPL